MPQSIDPLRQGSKFPVGPTQDLVLAVRQQLFCWEWVQHLTAFDFQARCLEEELEGLWQQRTPVRRVLPEQSRANPQ